MEDDRQQAALSAIANATRRRMVELIAEGPCGRAPHEMADALGIPRNLVSSHLAILMAAGLVSSEQRGRSRIYSAIPERIRRIAAALDGLADRAERAADGRAADGSRSADR